MFINLPKIYGLTRLFSAHWANAKISITEMIFTALNLSVAINIIIKAIVGPITGTKSNIADIKPKINA